MRKTRKIQAVGIAAAVAAGSLFSAAPANANFIKDMLRKNLTKQLEKNPSQISNPGFQLQAISVDLAIPATLRLNANQGKNKWGPSSSKVRFEIGELLGLGTKEATLYGSQSLKLRLGWPLGTVKMELPAQSGGDLTPGGKGLNAAPVALFTDPNVSSQPFAQNGCSDFGGTGIDNPLTAPHGVDGAAGAAEWLATSKDSTNRTAPLSLAVRDTVHGSANIFNHKIEDFTLTTQMNFANVMRLPSGADRCRQAWTGSTATTVPVRLGGTVGLAPGITKDLKLKLGNLTLSTPAGEETNVVLPACLTPYKFYGTAANAKTPLAQPNAACGADGSSLPASQGGSPQFNGTGFGKVDVPAAASVSNLQGELLIG